MNPGESVLTRIPLGANSLANPLLYARSAAFDATDSQALQQFFADLPTQIDHVLVTAGGPNYVPLLEMD